MRVLLDVNVILDALLQRLPWCKEADEILQAAAQRQVSCATTTLSVATIFYLGKKVVGTTVARADVRRLRCGRPPNRDGQRGRHRPQRAANLRDANSALVAAGRPTRLCCGGHRLHGQD